MPRKHKSKSKFLDLHQPNDPPAIKLAIAALEDERLVVERPSLHQLKIGPLNFYASTGTIQLDGQAALKQRGLPALMKYIRDNPGMFAHYREF